MKCTRLIILSVLTVSVVAMATATTAQAAPPKTQPTWFHFSKALEANIAFTSGALTTRFWITSKALVIVCKSGVGSGTLGTAGKDKGEITYEGCKPFTPEENTNTPKQFEEGKEYLNCEVKTGTLANGMVAVKNLKSRLAWWNVAAPNLMLDVYESETPPAFVEIKVEGVNCLARGTYAIEGSVASLVPFYSTAAVNEEVTMGNEIFAVANVEVGGKAVITQAHQKWIVENGGAGNEGVAELFILEGAMKKQVQLESAEQIELNRVTNKRPLFAAHE